MKLRAGVPHSDRAARISTLPLSPPWVLCLGSADPVTSWRGPCFAAWPLGPRRPSLRPQEASKRRGKGGSFWNPR